MNEDNNHRMAFDPIHSEGVLDTSLECILNIQNIDYKTIGTCLSKTCKNNQASLSQTFQIF